MTLVTNFDDILSLAPCLITGESFDDGLQSRLVEVDQHRYIVDLPLNEVTVVETASVGESELQLLRYLSGHIRFDIRNDGLIVAPGG